MRVTGYQSHGVAASVDLVNAVTLPTGDDSDEALREILQTNNFFAHEYTPAHGRLLRPWAHTLRGFFETDSLEAAVGLLNELLAAVPMHPHLSDHGDLGLHMHHAPPSADLAHRFRATTLMCLSDLVCEHGLSRTGVCAAAGCERVYADTSRSGRRRFCSDGCANRTGVAAFRARNR